MNDLPAAGPRTTIPLRFQRAELQQHAGLSPTGLQLLSATPGPEALIAALTRGADQRDAAAALALMLPRRQAVWWACLAVRLIPGVGERLAEGTALNIAESWVQTQRDEDVEPALAAAQLCASRAAAGWAAMAAYWCGPSLAPRGQQAVPPAPHLAGVAVRTALLFATFDPALGGRLTYPDLVSIGLELMQGGLGRTAQEAVRARLARHG